MKFSILIANYNNGRFFQDCYQSVISQTYSDWEAVIVDDYSSDHSLEIIHELIKDDNRFRIYTNEANEGVGITKSRLIDLAKGDICGFLDPDDALSPGAINSAMEVFKNHDDIVLCYSKFYKCDERLIPLHIPKISKQVLNDDPYFFNCPVVMVQFVCFRKSVYLKTLGIDAVLQIAEDQDLYLKMYEKGRVLFINEVNYYYRMHEGGISQNGNMQRAYQYFGRVIFNAMRRRGLREINGKAIPENYSDSREIFDLLKYQTEPAFRFKRRIKLLYHVMIRKLRVE
ncbi:MAG: glycosyltransferase family 2 protein [Chryseobacterium taeanense]